MTSKTRNQFKMPLVSPYPSQSNRNKSYQSSKNDDRGTSRYLSPDRESIDNNFAEYEISQGHGCKGVSCNMCSENLSLIKSEEKISSIEFLRTKKFGRKN